MDKTVLLALLTSIVSIIITLINTKNTARANADLATLKFELDQKKTELDASNTANLEKLKFELDQKKKEIDASNTTNLEKLKFELEQKKKEIEANNTSNLERLKFELEQKRKEIETKNAKQNEHLQRIIALVKNIQVAKDILIRIITCPQNSFGWTSANEQYKKAKDNYVTLYEDCCANLEGDVKMAAHKAKNDMINLDFLLETFINGNTFIKLNDEQLKELKIFRDGLNDIQNIIRDNK